MTTWEEDAVEDGCGVGGGGEDGGGEEDAVEEEARRRGAGSYAGGRRLWCRGVTWEEDEGCSVGGGRGLHSGRSM